MKKSKLPFRLGATSYIYQAAILPNVRQLAPLVDDVELVLFEVDEQNPLPTPAEIAELRAWARAYDLTYTVHLPLDLRLAASNKWRRHALEKARRVIHATRSLRPWAYVVHLDGAEIAHAVGATPDEAALQRWRDHAARSLELLAREVRSPDQLTLENLESYGPDALLPLLDGLPVGLCVDVGHMLKRGEDPLPFLRANLARTRVVHLHGCRDGRDHQGLDQMPGGLLEALLGVLLRENYRGVVTLELFAEHHFFPGQEMLLAALEALR